MATQLRVIYLNLSNIIFAMELLNILVYLAKNGALSRPIAVTTCGMGKELGISQQSVSRWLTQLERKGYTERQKGIRGHIVQITPRGRKPATESAM